MKTSFHFIFLLFIFFVFPFTAHSQESHPELRKDTAQARHEDSIHKEEKRRDDSIRYQEKHKPRNVPLKKHKTKIDSIIKESPPPERQAAIGSWRSKKNTGEMNFKYDDEINNDHFEASERIELLELLRLFYTKTIPVEILFFSI